MAPVVLVHPVLGRIYINEVLSADLFLHQLAMSTKFAKPEAGKSGIEQRACDANAACYENGSSQQETMLITQPPSCPREVPLIEDSGTSTESPRSFCSFSEPNPLDSPAQHQSVGISTPPDLSQPEGSVKEVRFGPTFCQTFSISTPPEPSLPKDPVEEPLFAPPPDQCVHDGVVPLRPIHLPPDSSSLFAPPPDQPVHDDVAPPRPKHCAPGSSSELLIEPLLEEVAALKRSFTRVGQALEQRQHCCICSAVLGPDDPMPCFPDFDPSRQCISCLMAYEQDLIEEHAPASSVS